MGPGTNYSLFDQGDIADEEFDDRDDELSGDEYDLEEWLGEDG